MTCHIAICDDDSRDAGYVSELLHQWAQLRGCTVTEERFLSAEGFLFHYEEDRSFDRLKRRDPIWSRRFAYSGDWPEECTPASCP